MKSTILSTTFSIFIIFSLSSQVSIQNVADFVSAPSVSTATNGEISIFFETAMTNSFYGIYPNANVCNPDIKFRLGGGSLFNSWTEVNTEDVFMVGCFAFNEEMKKSSQLVADHPSMLKSIGNIEVFKTNSYLRSNDQNNQTSYHIDPVSLSKAFPGAVRHVDADNYQISIKNMLGILLSAAQEQNQLLNNKINQKDNELKLLQEQFVELRTELDQFKKEFRQTSFEKK